MIVADLLRCDSDVLQSLIQRLSVVAEHDSAVMREVISYELIAIESAHFLDRENTDTAEGLGCHRKDLALCCICAEVSICRGLQAIEGDVARIDVAFDGSVAPFCRMRVRHDLLIVEVCSLNSGGAGIAAVEAHEAVGQLVVITELALDIRPVHILRDRVVDVEKGDRLLADAPSDVLGKSTVDINLAGYRDAASGQTAVDIAGNETEHILECRPALRGQSHILTIALVLVCPVSKSQLILRELLQHFGSLLLGVAHLIHHVLADSSDSLIAFMLLISLEKIELRLLFNFHVEVVKLLDRSIACKEVCRSRAEGDDLQIGEAQGNSCDRKEVVDIVRGILCITDRVLRNPCVDIAESEVVACVQHAAVCIAASLNTKRVRRFLSCCDEHLRSVKMLCKQGLGNFRSEIAKVNAESVASCLLDILQCMYHVDFALDNGNRALINVICAILLRISLDDSLPAVYGERCREAVSRHGHNTNFYGRDVTVHSYPPEIVFLNIFPARLPSPRILDSINSGRSRPAHRAASVRPRISLPGQTILSNTGFIAG